MAMRLSTGLRNALAGGRSTVTGIMVGNTISFDSASKEIRDSGDGLVTAGFKAGDKIQVKGTSSNDGIYTAVSVAVGAIVVEEAVADESAGSYIAIAAGRGGAINDIFREGIIEIRSGSQPASANDAESGTLLVTITDNGSAHDSATGENGLEMDDAADLGVVEKKAAQTWKGTAVNSGTAGWFRFFDRSHTTGQSTSARRFDGAVATSGAELNMASTAITASQTVTIDGFAVTIPAS